MVLDGASFEVRHLEVSDVAVLNWFNATSETIAEAPAKPSGEIEQIELDEIFTFASKKRKGLHHHRRRAGNTLFYELAGGDRAFERGLSGLG